MVQILYFALHDALQHKARRGEATPRWLITAVAIPWVTVLSSLAALTGWVLWLIHSESARRSTHSVVEGFDLSLKREPWPLWSPVITSCTLLPVLAMLLLTAWARERIQRRVAAGDPPFNDSRSPCPGSDPGPHTASTHRAVTSPRGYFAIAVTTAAVAWLTLALLVSLMVCFGVWAAAMSMVTSATSAVKPYASALSSADTAAAATERTAQGFAAMFSFQSGAGLGRGSWGPGGFCPPGCVDLSAFSYYLGDETCCCNTIGGVFAAGPHAAAATHSLARAMVGLVILGAAVSWLLLAAGCQIAHTEAEAVLCSETTCAAAAQAGEPLGRGAAVQRLSLWLTRRMGGGGINGGVGARAGAGQEGSTLRDPLVGGGRP